MHTPVTDSLAQLLSFTILGFFMGVFYEIIRIIRLFKRQSDLAVSLTDFFFLTFAGLITFAYSMELGSGDFRWFYVAGQVFGAGIYFMTVGRLISLASNFIVKWVKRITKLVLNCIFRVLFLLGKYFCAPVRKKLCALLLFLKGKIVHFYGFLVKQVIILSKHLKTGTKMIYNKKTPHKENTEERLLRGETRNVIKGKTRSAVTKANVTVRKT